MTAEEVLEILSNNLYESKIIHEYKDGKFDYRKIVEWFLSQTPIMETYASEREAKYKELWGAMKDLIKLYGGRLSDHAVYLSIHGIEETEGNIKLGELFRKQITSLEQELGLNKE